MSESPFFSVVVATYNRGEHIIPTIKSVLSQTETSFEVIVVGDGCTDNTGDVVKSFRSSKISWVNLATNGGSQSFANNAGVEKARGKWIAYLGHDDIWTDDHLAQLRQAASRSPNSEFVVSGCVFWGPPDSSILLVTGIFEESIAAQTHFFPPSSLSHLRRVAAWCGGWRDPNTIAQPVDADFVLRAVEERFHFTSTRKVTVHKFAAGHRYLSYLRQSSSEQADIFASMQEGSAPSSDEIVSESMRRDQFMIVRHTKPEIKGGIFQANRRNKGLALPPLQSLTKLSSIPLQSQNRAMDWLFNSENSEPYLSSFQNPRPKLLIPFTGGSAKIEIQLNEVSQRLREDGLSLLVDDTEILATVCEDLNGKLALRANIELNQDDYTVLTFLLLPQRNSFTPSLVLQEYEDLKIFGLNVRPVVI